MPLDQHINRAIRRSRAFCRAATPGHFLISAWFPVPAPAVPPLYQCPLEMLGNLERYVHHLFEAARPGFAAKDGLDDDSIPSVCPRFGIAEHAAWLGMDVRLQENTCLPTPIIHGPDDLKRIRLSVDDRWFGYMQRGYQSLQSLAQGLCVLSVRGTLSPMELANLARGDDLFTDFVDDPPFVHRLLDKLTDAIAWYFDHLVSWTDELSGGHVFMYGSLWLPSRTIGHLSNDAAMLCGPQVYREFGFPYEQRLVRRYDHCFYHVHNEKLHFLRDLVKLPDLLFVEVTNDPRSPRVVDDLDRVLWATEPANLMIQLTSDELRQHVGQLKCRNVVLNVQCRDRADAQDAVRLVRSESKPLE
jgi:hypothetical protein